MKTYKEPKIPKKKKNRGGLTYISYDVSGYVIKSFFVLALITLIMVVLFLGFIDWIVPENLTAFNIDDLNKNPVITYGKGNSPFYEFLTAPADAYKSGSRSVFGSSVKKSSAALVQGAKSASAAVRGADTAENIYTARLFGIIPVKKVKIEVFPETYLIPGGIPFGVKFYTDGVLVVGTSEIDTESGAVNPARSAGIKSGDTVTAINGAAVKSVAEAAKLIEESGGEAIIIDIIRDGKDQKIKLTPVYSTADAKFKSGIWLRDSAAGIGTVTYINPSNHVFGGLGHGICDVDTGKLMPLRKGVIVNSAIESVVKGKPETPGELKGKFREDIGTLLANTENGVFGIISDIPFTTDEVVPLPIGLRGELEEGEAFIFSTTNGTAPEKYTIEIEKIYRNSENNKNFLIKITDPRLLELTGGIVQGMSGSPIIQKGKLVGAVTHVLVSDPAKGYGIFIDNMLASMPEVLK